MSTTNWLGQEISAGTIVGRGARDGNTSSFKVGRVVAIKSDGSVRVEWLWLQDCSWLDGIKVHRRVDIYSFGNPHRDTLFVLDPDTFEVAVPEGTL